jgi:7-cyano-7-deazaguanine synthase
VESLIIGVHQGDHAIYPDCRPEFIDAMNATLQLSDWNKVRLYAPFLVFDKAGIVKEGLVLNVPFENTWTCYKGREKACGKCGSCVERLEAFQLNNAKDPLDYEV